MTIKTISEIAGVTGETVRAKGKELFPCRFEKGKKTVFTQDEATKIMSELRKRGFVLPTENLYVPTENLEDRMTRMEIMIEKLLSVVTLQINQNHSVKQIEAPKVKSRDQISKLVRESAHKNKIDYSTAWNELYTEFAYRTNSNPRTSAKNRGMTIIDYIETEGMIETLLAIAKEVL